MRDFGGRGHISIIYADRRHLRWPEQVSINKGRYTVAPTSSSSSSSSSSSLLQLVVAAVVPPNGDDGGRVFGK